MKMITLWCDYDGKTTSPMDFTSKVVVLLIKPIAFLPFSLPLPSSLLKLPIIFMGPCHLSKCHLLAEIGTP